VRRVELTTALPASQQAAWEVLTDTDAWPSWGGLVTSAEGALEPGAAWRMRLRPRHPGGPPRLMTPTLVSLEPPRRITFETRIAGGWAVRIRHTFELERSGPDACLLRQTFEVTGPLVAPLWPPVRRGVVQFEELGEDLARRLVEVASRA